MKRLRSRCTSRHLFPIIYQLKLDKLRGCKEILRGDFVSFSSFLLWPALTLTHYFTYHSFFILVRSERAVTYRYPLITDIPNAPGEHFWNTTNNTLF
jgi:hypothetical protein